VPSPDLSGSPPTTRMPDYTETSALTRQASTARWPEEQVVRGEGTWVAWQASTARWPEEQVVRGEGTWVAWQASTARWPEEQVVRGEGTWVAWQASTARWPEEQVVRGEGTWVAWQAAHAEAGQDPLKRPSMAFFGISCTLLIAVCKLAMFVSILYSVGGRPAFYLPFRPTPEKSVLNVEGTT
jgi:hypothetical protein